MNLFRLLEKCACSALIAVVVLAFGATAHAEKAIFFAPHAETKIVEMGQKTLPLVSPTTTFSRNGITFYVYYMDVINNTNYGFDGASTGAPAQARLQEVLEYVADVINMSGTLNVLVEPSSSATSGFLAFAGSYYPLANGFSKPSSLRRLETGTAPWPTDEEIGMQVRFGNINWNLTTNPPDISEYDFYSVLLHEITHGLGFGSLMSSTGLSVFNPNSSYTLYDTHLYGNTTAGLVITNPGPAFVGVAAERANNPSLLAFNGPLTQLDYGSRPGIYAPSPFTGSSSYSHWNTGNVTGNPVMEHSFFNGEMVREYESYEIEALKDIGWVNAAPLGIQVQFENASYNVGEADGNILVNVVLSEQPGATTVMVDYETGAVGDTATNNVDYDDANGTLSFTGSVVSQSFNITINDDLDIEGDETMTLTLSNVQNGNLGTNDVVTLTIVDDEVDTDGDGLLDSEEALLCTSPTNPDSDSDGINDYDEVTNFGQNSVSAYNPGITNTDACNRDTDNDGFSDKTEWNFGTDPLNQNDVPALPLASTLTLMLAIMAIGLAAMHMLRRRTT